MYKAVARRCTRSVHAVNGRVDGHIHDTYTAVHTGRKHGPLHGREHGRVHGHGRTMYIARARPCTVCTRPWAAVYRLCTADLGRVQTVYTAVHGPCTWPVRVPNTAVCTQPVRGKTGPGTRPLPDRVRTVYMAVHGRVHGRLHGRLYGPCARPCTYHVQGRAWSVHEPNTAVYTVVYLYTAVFTARVRGRVPCTCTCLWPVYTAVHGRVQTAYGPCTWSVYDTNAAAAPTRPCLQPVPCTRPFTACMDRVHHDTVHFRHHKS